MNRTLFTSFWAFVLLCLVQDSLSANVHHGHNQNQRGSNDLADALLRMYNANSPAILKMEEDIKRSIVDQVQNFELDEENIKYVVRIIDATLSAADGKVGSIWRKFKKIFTSGAASKLLKNVDLNQVYENLFSNARDTVGNYFNDQVDKIEHTLDTISMVGGNSQQ